MTVTTIRRIQHNILLTERAQKLHEIRELGEQQGAVAIAEKSVLVV